MLRFFALMAPLIALFATPAAAQDSIYFQSPSGNIGCVISTGEWNEARCDVMEITAPIPPAPVDCELDYGHAFSIAPEETLGIRLCAGDSVFDPSAMVLEYGEQVDLGSFTCQSDETGMTCFNYQGHGFAVSKGAQELF